MSFFISRAEIIDKINLFARQGRSFLFAIDFPGERGFVLTPEEAVAHGVRYDLGGVSAMKDKDVAASVSEDHPGPYRTTRSESRDCNGIPDSFRSVPHNKERSEITDYVVTPDPYRWVPGPVGFQTYRNAFDKVSFHLKRGDTYLLNLTFPTALDTDLSLDTIFRLSEAPYKLLVPGHFVVFSPEIFIRITGSVIASYPMKGTISAELPGAEKLLLEDEKEFFEHNTIVDLIRNDLSMVSTGVRVSRFRYLDRVVTNRGDLLQASSEIQGTLPSDFHQKLGEILFTLLPPGSVTGAPKQKTVEIISDAESYERGFYTGIFGFFDGTDLVSAVSIRFIEQDGEKLVFKSGGGITALSNAGREYEEMIRKVYVPFV